MGTTPTNGAGQRERTKVEREGAGHSGNYPHQREWGKAEATRTNGRGNGRGKVAKRDKE